MARSSSNVTGGMQPGLYLNSPHPSGSTFMSTRLFAPEISMKIYNNEDNSNSCGKIPPVFGIQKVEFEYASTFACCGFAGKFVYGSPGSGSDQSGSGKPRYRLMARI